MKRLKQTLDTISERVNAQPASRVKTGLLLVAVPVAALCVLIVFGIVGNDNSAALPHGTISRPMDVRLRMDSLHRKAWAPDTTVTSKPYRDNDH